MKPRNERERTAMRLSHRLPELTKAQMDWVRNHTIEKKGYYSGKKVWCSQCGTAFDKETSSLIVSTTGDEAMCPICGADLELEVGRARHYQTKTYVTIITVKEGWQVCRHFMAQFDYQKGKEMVLTVNEAVQNWIDRDGKEVILARKVASVPYYVNRWNFDNPMDVKDRKIHFSPYFPERYDINAAYIYPRVKVLDVVKRNGFRGDFYNETPSIVIKKLLADNDAEMLLKTGQLSLFKIRMSENREIFIPSIKICNRNGYIVEDASLWLDYMDALRYMNLDLRNAHYICPDNLAEAHDKAMKKKKRMEARIERERRIKEAAKREEQYKKDKGRFFGICFGDGTISVSVISSVAEMAEEGEMMHHCVYTMGYYKKKNSLILSAKSIDGERLETIEVDLRTFKIAQARAVCNGMSEKHKEIIDLVNENMNLIRQAI